jgi:hypothetical protein
MMPDTQVNSSRFSNELAKQRQRCQIVQKTQLIVRRGVNGVLQSHRCIACFPGTFFLKLAAVCNRRAIIAVRFHYVKVGGMRWPFILGACRCLRRGVVSLAKPPRRTILPIQVPRAASAVEASYVPTEQQGGATSRRHPKLLVSSSCEKATMAEALYARRVRIAP